jgi:dienelactone hydrolase
MLTTNSFGGEVLSPTIIDNPAEWGKLDLPGFMGRNSKSVRGPEIVAFTRHLRTLHRRIGVIGFCYGGWAVFHLGVKSNEPRLVDCISAAHPTFLEKDEMLNVGVPVQIMAPETDPQFTEELKAFAVSEIPKLGLPFDYQYFPGLEHGFSVRGNLKDEAEVKGLERAKRAAVAWFKEWLVDSH